MVDNNDGKISNTNVNKDNKNIKKKKINKKSKNKLILIIIIVAILVILLISLFILKNKKINIEKQTYDEKMEVIGFSKYYTDDSQYVKKIEALKIILCVATNTNDAYKVLYSTKENEDDKWIDVAYDIKMAPLNYFEYKDENISLVDVLELLGMAKENILNKEINDVENVKLKDFNEYFDYYQKYIKDMIANEIIENKEENLNGFEDITKAKFNEIVTKYILKYNTLVDQNEKIDYQKSLNLTKNKKYPFVLEGVDNKAYQKDFEIKNEEKFLNPNELYKKFGRIKYNVANDYINNMANIDYETINEDEFYNKINDFSTYSKEDVQNYIKYVKENKIKVSSDVKIVKPIVYFDGENYRLRVQIQYEIQNSNTNNNIFIFDDKNSNTKYSNKDTIYLDLKVEINEYGYISKLV